jgi:hypothetical protein
MKLLIRLIIGISCLVLTLLQSLLFFLVLLFITCERKVVLESMVLLVRLTWNSLNQIFLVLHTILVLKLKYLLCHYDQNH